MLARWRALAALATAAAAGVPIPAPAWAHGIGDATSRTVLGWDHLLFIAGALLVARQLAPAAKLTTVF